MEVVPASATYTVLARRYRPQGFEEVIGQEHIATSLRNAILSGRVAHAYLFTGARGVGKTSTARILAKALNCPNAVEGAPCNHCAEHRQKVFEPLPIVFFLFEKAVHSKLRL